jgi:hypothetical protein
MKLWVGLRMCTCHKNGHFDREHDVLNHQIERLPLIFQTNPHVQNTRGNDEDFCRARGPATWRKFRGTIRQDFEVCPHPQ